LSAVDDVARLRERRRVRAARRRVSLRRGLVRDALAEIPAREFALIRLDGDLYESTMNSLDAPIE